MTIKMIKERIMVEIMNNDSGKSLGGVMLPNAEARNEGIGIVVAVGPLVDGVEIGDRVVYLKGTAAAVRIKGREHHVFDVPSVLYIDA